MLLFANENQNARCQRQDSHYDCRDSDVEQQSDSGENKVDSEEQHSEVLGDVHAAFLRQRQRVCTLKVVRCWTSLDRRWHQNRVTHAV